MATVVLYKHADKIEGVVKTESWGGCRSDTCRHFSHDPYFEYRVTEIDGEIIWEGEVGEKIVRSNDTGRVFYTIYSPDGHYAPAMYTVELAVEDGKIVLGPELSRLLIRRYESPRHEALLALADIAEIELH